jgi:hypothetical protein
MYTWYTVKDGRIDLVEKTHGHAAPPGEGWQEAPNDWGGNPMDKLDWFDGSMHRILDNAALVALGKRTDKRGTYWNKETRESRQITELDKLPKDYETNIPPLEDEPYQKWDEASGAWVVDTAAKEKAEKEQEIAVKKAAIEDAEKRIQRSLIAIQAGSATQEDRQYFNQINTEIESLREQLKQLLAA